MDESYVEVIVLVIDQATFDGALGEFLDEVTQVVALLPLKAPGVDFAAELQQIQGAKAKLDAALAAAKTADPAPAPDEPVAASGAAEAPAGDVGLPAGPALAFDPAAVVSGNAPDGLLEDSQLGEAPAEVLPADPAPAQDAAAADPSAV